MTTWKHWGYDLAPEFKPRTSLMKTVLYCSELSRQPKPLFLLKWRQSNQLYGLKAMWILQLSKWVAMVQCDKMENGSLKPQVQGKGWHLWEEVPDDESTSRKIQWNDQEAIEGSKSFSLKILKLSFVMLNMISKSMLFWGDVELINGHCNILCNVMLWFWWSV